MVGVGAGERWLMLWACAVALLALGCSDHDCNRPPALVYALIVGVVDAETREPICDATVMFERNGVASRGLPGICRYPTSSDRPGTYHVTVEHPDYQTIETDVAVAAGECGYGEQREVEIELTAQ